MFVINGHDSLEEVVVEFEWGRLVCESFFFSSLAERAITAVPVTALQKEAIETSSAMPRIHQAETKQTKEDKTKSNQAKQTTQHQPNTNQSQTPEWKQSSLFLYNIQLK